MRRSADQTAERLTASKISENLEDDHFLVTATVMATALQASLTTAQVSMQGSPRELEKEVRKAVALAILHERNSLRPRLESPARRRNSSAEGPGPSDVMSALERAHQHALRLSVQPLHGSHLQNRLHRQL